MSRRVLAARNTVQLGVRPREGSPAKAFQTSPTNDWTAGDVAFTRSSSVSALLAVPARCVFSDLFVLLDLVSLGFGLAEVQIMYSVYPGIRQWS